MYAEALTLQGGGGAEAGSDTLMITKIPGIVSVNILGGGRGEGATLTLKLTHFPIKYNIKFK